MIDYEVVTETYFTLSSSYTSQSVRHFVSLTLHEFKKKRSGEIHFPRTFMEVVGFRNG